MSNRFINPRDQFLDPTPSPYAGGLLYFYETGSVTPADTFSDSDLSTANTNPVVLNSAGRLPNSVFMDPNVTYKVVLKDSDGVTIWTEDPVSDPAANVTAAFQVYAGDPNGNLAGSAGTPGGSGSSVAWDITNNLLYVCTTTGNASTAVWTQIGATLAGAIQKTGIISPTALASDQNDYSPTGNSTASIIRQDASANVVITGLAGGVVGAQKTYINTSADKTQTLADGAFNTSSAAANRFAFGGNSIILYPGQSIELIYDATTSRWRQEGTHPMLPMPSPGGRLTLESGVPVSTSDQIDKTTIYYTPYMHGFVPLYNGSNWYVAPFSELSQTLADDTKSPLAAATNTLYDMFVWNDAGTLRLSRGPAWSSSTSRGTGAGTTELERVNGIYVNKVAITNGPAAQRGLYVGTIATDGSGANGELNMMFRPTAAAGGSANRLDVWNMYHRVAVTSLCRDSTNTWTYSTATTRSANNSASNRVTAVFGLSEDAVRSRYSAPVTSTTSNSMARVGVGRDSTTGFDGVPGQIATQSGSSGFQVIGHDSGQPAGIGSHYFQALERAELGTVTWYGDDNAPTITQMALTVEAVM